MYPACSFALISLGQKICRLIKCEKEIKVNVVFTHQLLQMFQSSNLCQTVPLTLALVTQICFVLLVNCLFLFIIPRAHFVTSSNLYTNITLAVIRKLFKGFKLNASGH